MNRTVTAGDFHQDQFLVDYTVTCTALLDLADCLPQFINPNAIACGVEMNAVTVLKGGRKLPPRIHEAAANVHEDASRIVRAHSLQRGV